MKNIIFFNPFHKGDLHVSRSLIKKIIELLPDYNYFYGHRYDNEILKDLPLTQISFPTKITNEHIVSLLDGDDLYLNTWYGCDHQKYLQKYGLTLDCLYFIFKDHLMNNFQIELPVEDYFPTIDFSKYDLQPIRQWLKSHNQKMVLICNGPSLSGQGIHVNWNQIINKYKENYSVIVTQKTNDNQVFFTSDIIQKTQGSDLNEIAFLSQFCDVILGSASGPQTFSFHQGNIYRDCKFYFYSNLESNGKFWLGETFSKVLEYKAEIKNFQHVIF